MKTITVLGNWKANKTLGEASVWIETFKNTYQVAKENTVVIVCPAYHHIGLFTQANLHISLGIQNISTFPSGAYTGEIAASMLKDSGITHVMVGHSERRHHLGETNEHIAQKTLRILEHGLKPVVCVSTIEEVTDLKSRVPEFSGRGILLYETLSSIGSGHAVQPEDANTFAQQCKSTVQAQVLYGGSVTEKNVRSFIEQEHIDGVGVGGASLDAAQFISLINNAS